MHTILAGVVVFATSAAILMLEILAGRLLAPYVGQTLETWTGIIGVVLAGIALGTWLGGRAADRMDPRLLLPPLVLAGGVLALLTLPLITFFGAALAGTGAFAILALAFIGFFAPAAVLSGVAPTVVKLQLSSLDETGGVVGRLSALGTAGALVGTFVTGFFLLAAVPTRPLLLALGLGLVAGGAVLWLVLRPAGRPAPTGLMVLAVVGVLGTLAARGPCDRESAYFCARVEADPARPSGRSLYLDTLRHSYVDLADPAHLEFAYTRAFGDVIGALPDGRLAVLHIGGAGFSMPRWVAATRPGSTNVVLELDPEMVALAQSELGLDPDQQGLDIVVGDARLSLAGQPEGQFDVVIGDAFGGLAVPWHLTTREFVSEIRTRLRPGGLYVLNVIDYPPLAFARAEVATLRDVFAHVALVARPERVTGDSGGNLVLVASDAELPVGDISARLAARGADEIVLTGAEVESFAGDARVLVDDWAPVDQLLSPVN